MASRQLANISKNLLKSKGSTDLLARQLGTAVAVKPNRNPKIEYTQVTKYLPNKKTNTNLKKKCSHSACIYFKL